MAKTEHPPINPPASRRLRRILGAVIVALALLAPLAPAQTASADVNVYTTPGRHHVNGRDWKTSCENYSSNIRRCRTQIKSSNRWVFNNLTYLSSPRSYWGNNRLAKNGRWTTEGGRKWTTECDTPKTGRNACRSYIWSGGTWVFNNMVVFGKATSAPTPGTPVTTPTAAPGPGIWQPKGTMAWHVQYQGTTATPKVAVFNLDGVDTSAARVAELHASGAKVICYFNAGGVEDWRSDFKAFPASVKGKALDGWTGERWIDIRQLDVLTPIMAARMDTCKQKGFDAVDPDNMDGYTNVSGFPLKSTDALNYQRTLIKLAHDRGLAIGLKNTTALLPTLAPEIDFAVNEQCQEYNECGDYTPLVKLGKPVFNIEYDGTCATQPAGFSRVIASYDLDGKTTSCR